MYVPAKASEGQHRDRRCHILTSLSVSATSWTLLLSPFLSHSISLPPFSVLCVSPPFLCYVSTVALLSSFSLRISCFLFLSLRLHSQKSTKFENTLRVKTQCVFSWFCKEAL